MMAGSAVVLAVSVPFLRWLAASTFHCLVVVVLAQSVACSSVVFFFARRRKRLQDESGLFLGSGRHDETGKRIFSSETMMVGTILHLILSQCACTAISTWMVTEHPLLAIAIVVWTSLLSWMLALRLSLIHFIRFLRWGLYLDSIAFYERGMSIMDRLVPWQRLQLRRCEATHQSWFSRAIATEKVSDTYLLKDP